MSQLRGPMYCAKHAIAGLEAEKALADRLLAKRFRGRPGLILLPVEGSAFVYGQATFRLDGFADGAEAEPFKFVDRLETIATNGVLTSLVKSGNPSEILVMDAGLKARLDAHPGFSSVRHLLALEVDFSPKQGFFRRLFGGGAAAVPAPAPPKNSEAAVASDTVAAALGRIRTETDLTELLTFGRMLLCCCAIDLMRDQLEERVAGNGSDVVGRTALAIVETDFGDVTAGLEDARTAVKLNGAPPEAWLWYGKSALVGFRAAEAAEALQWIRSFPSSWPSRVRCRAAALQGAVALENKDYCRAEWWLTQAIDTDGSMVALHLLLAKAQLARGRAKEAQGTLNDASLINPQFPPTVAALARFHYEHGTPADISKLEPRLRESTLGRLTLKNLREQASIEELQAAEWLEPAVDWALIHSVLPTWQDFSAGTAFAALYGMAVFDGFRPAPNHATGLTNGFSRLEKDPLDWAGYAAMGLSWYLLDRSDMAELWADASVALAPHERITNDLFVDVLRELKAYRHAHKALHRASTFGVAAEHLAERAAALSLQVPIVDDLRALLVRPNGRSSAQGVIDRLASDSSTAPGRLVLEAGLHWHSDYESAVGALKKAIDLRPDELDLERFLYLIQVSAGRARDAGETLHRLARHTISESPTVDAEGFWLIAKVALANSGPELALQYAEAALILDPRHLGAAKVRGDALQQIQPLRRI